MRAPESMIPVRGSPVALGALPGTTRAQKPRGFPAPAAGDGAAGARLFFTGAGLPLFLLAATLGYELFLLAVVFAPENTTAWGGFAREFKQWCFRYDARTGGMEWAAVWVMLAEPIFVVAVAVLLSRRSLALVRTSRDWRRQAPAIVGGGLAAALAMAGLYIYGQPAAGADRPLPFPAERIRTHLQPPPFHFVDQTGRPFSLEELRGRVVLVTGIYALCSTACPEILRETKALLESLPAADRERVSVVALSLNPEYETSDLMTAVVAAHGFTHPHFRYLNGDPAGMHDVLTRLGFSRVRDPRTGLIDHANLLFLLDDRGEIAYRFTLDARHRSWLREGILSLVKEANARDGH